MIKLRIDMFLEWITPLNKELREQAELKRKLAEVEDDKMTLEQQLETGFKLG